MSVSVCSYCVILVKKKTIERNKKKKSRVVKFVIISLQDVNSV